MDKYELTDYIVKELARHRRPADIVTDVCERTGMHWNEAQKFVYDVAYEQRKGIAARQSPMIIAFSIGLIVTGLILTVFMLSALVNGVSFAAYGVPYFGNALAIGFGVVLVAGGVIGLWKRIKTFFMD